MPSITRRSSLGWSGAIPVAATLTRMVWTEAEPANSWAGGEVSNASWRLLLFPEQGLRNAQVIHIPSGLHLADGDYRVRSRRRAAPCAIDRRRGGVPLKRSACAAPPRRGAFAVPRAGRSAGVRAPAGCEPRPELPVAPACPRRGDARARPLGDAFASGLSCSTKCA